MSGFGTNGSKTLSWCTVQQCLSYTNGGRLKYSQRVFNVIQLQQGGRSPGEGHLKCNVDGALPSQGSKVGFGFIIRNQAGDNGSRKRQAGCSN